MEIGRRLRPRVLLPGHVPSASDAQAEPEQPALCACGRVFTSLAQLGWHQFLNPRCSRTAVRPDPGVETLE